MLLFPPQILLLPQVAAKTNIIALFLKVNKCVDVIRAPFKYDLLNRSHNLLPIVILLDMLMISVFEHLFVGHVIFTVRI